MSIHFPYRFDKRYLPVFVGLRVGRDDGVEVTDDGRLVASFGWVRVDTPISNVEHTEVTGPHRWWTAVGLRLSFADDGLTFGTNYERGLCIAFAEPIPRVIGLRRHSALWVSVSDPAGLAAAITEAGGGSRTR